MSTFMNAHTTAFEKKTALLMNRLSCLVYETDEQRLRDAVDALGFPNMQPVVSKKTGTYGIVVWDDEAVVIVFRGTEDLADVIVDANIRLTKGVRGKVHSGFSKALDSVWDQIMGILSALSAQPKHRSYWLTGHSLGAALATLAAANLLFKENDRPINGVYTYGSPRVGNEAFSLAYNTAIKSRTFRFVNNNDMVTRVPTRGLGYRHVGTMLYLTSKCKIETDIHFWNLFLDRIKGDLDGIRHIKWDPANDHHCPHYLACLEKVAGSAEPVVVPSAGGGSGGAE